LKKNPLGRGSRRPNQFWHQECLTGAENEKQHAELEILQRNWSNHKNSAEDKEVEFTS